MNVVEEIAVEVSKDFDIPIQWIFSPRRSRNIAWPRQYVMLIARNSTSLSLPQIGEALDRDHTTIIQGINAAEVRVERDPDLSRLVSRIGAKVAFKRKEITQRLSQNWRMRRAA